MKRFKILIDFCKILKKENIRYSISSNRYVKLLDYPVVVDCYKFNEVCVNSEYYGTVWRAINLVHFLALLNLEPFASHRIYSYSNFSDSSEILNRYLIFHKPRYETTTFNGFYCVYKYV